MRTLPFRTRGRARMDDEFVLVVLVNGNETV